MSLFPDRQLVSTSSRELMVVYAGLTEEQKRQLSSVAESYLKEYHLFGFENTRAVIPVIRNCVLDGLKAREKRENILPTDDLKAAFKKGYGDRIALIKTVEAELEGLSGQKRLEGPLALSQDLIRSATIELREKVFATKLRAGQEVAEIAKVRRPIFRRLVDYSRDKIEEDIPGSKQVALTPQQETGLVRNLVFGWAAFREPRLLLETEDFMVGAKVCLAEIAQHSGVLWEDLAQTVGQNSPEVVSYLKDISAQVADLLVSIPNKPPSMEDALAIASLINTAFIRLEGYFLIMNPFNKFPSLSEDPGDEGRSIWDENRSTTAVIGGVTFRLPTTSTLNLAAYLISGQNSTRAQEYRVGGKRVASLIEELEFQSLDRTIPNLQDKIEKDKQTLEKLKGTITRGDVPVEGAMARANVLELIKNQHELMLDEMQFIPTVRGYHEHLTNFGLDLARRYQGGDPLRSDSDLLDLLTFHYSPGVLRKQVHYFIRERIIKRIRGFEDLVVYGNFADAMMSEALTDYSKMKFSESLDVSVFDVLSFRNIFWLDQFLKPRPDLSQSQLRVAWTGILAQEKRRVEDEAYTKACRRVEEDMISEEKDRILANKDNPLGKQYAYIKDLQTRLKEGVIPDDESIYQRYLMKWRRGGEQRITSAMTEWGDEDKMTLLLKQKLDDEGRLYAQYVDNLSSFREKTEQPNGPLAVVLGALSMICPNELLPDYPITIEDVAHRVPYKNDSDPFSYTELGGGTRRKLNKKRLVLYSRFQDWLTTKGTCIGEDIFKESIKPVAMSDLIESGIAFHKLFGIEGELQTWYGNQRRKLKAQMGDYSPKFYHTHPLTLVHRGESGIASKGRNLESLRIRNSRRLTEMVTGLRQAGLIKPKE